jgi:hypothetical protein
MSYCNVEFDSDRGSRGVFCTREAGHSGQHFAFYRCSLCDTVFSPERIAAFELAPIPVRNGWGYYFEQVERAERVHYLRTPPEGKEK